MTYRWIKLLLIEDNPGDVELLQEAVAEAEEPRFGRAADSGGGRSPGAPHMEWVVVDRLDMAFRRLGEESFDIILLDLSLPDAQGFDTFARLYEHRPDVPIVVLTGLDDEELAVRTVQAGAQDYLVKAHLDGHLVVRAMRYAIERARLLISERGARAQAEAAQRRLELLATASNLLAASLEYETALDRVARLVVPILADWCAIDVIEEGVMVRRMAVAHADPEAVELARKWGHCAPDLDAPSGEAEVLRTGQPLLAREVRDLLPVRSGPDEMHLGILRALNPRAAMVIPLVARGRTLGAITFLSTTPGRQYHQSDLLLAEDLARRIGLAIDNARLYRTQKEIAHTLQRSLLPPRLPRIPGVDLHACYRPMGEGIEVGGDFYDVFRTIDGNWALVIGDVAGKGPAAAAVTSLARHTVRIVAMQTSSPGQVMAQANEAIVRQISDDTFCTLQYARLQPAANGVRISLASGGHPLPLLLRSHGQKGGTATVQRVGEPGMLIGVIPEARFPEHVLDLGPGDALVFYTDGVTEARIDGDLFGEERLEALVRTCAGLDARGIAERIEQTIVDFQAGQPRDDLAVLVLRIPDSRRNATCNSAPEPEQMRQNRSPVASSLLDREQCLPVAASASGTVPIAHSK